MRTRIFLCLSPSNSRATTDQKTVFKGSDAKTMAITRVIFQRRAKAELLFDGDVGNLLQQNQTPAEGNPTPADSSVNPPVCLNRKHSPLPEKRRDQKHTRVRWGNTCTNVVQLSHSILPVAQVSHHNLQLPPTPPAATCNI